MGMSRNRDSSVTTYGISGLVHVVMYSRHPIKERYEFESIAERPSSVVGDCADDNFIPTAHVLSTF